jgi:hypothetical protein
VPESGFYAWGGHVGWDVFTEAVGYAEACHEFGCITPLWVFDEFYAAAPAQAERGLRNLIYHFDSEQGVDFCRHATITKTVYSGWPEGLNLVHSLGWYAVAWMELYRKTGKEEYLRWTTQKIDHRLKTRDARTGLIAWDTQLDKNWTRLDALMWFIESLVKCAELCPDQAQRARYQQSAHELALACTRLPHVPTNSFIVYAVSFDGLAKDTVGRQRYEWFAGNKPVRFWGKIGHRWSPEASLLGSLFLYYYSLWGDKEFLDLGRGIFEQYMILPMPDDNNKRPVAGMYAGVIDLGVDLYLLTRDKSFLTKAEKVAEHAVRHLFRNGLFLDEKDLDYYEARSGGGQLAASLLHLHLALKKPGLKYERWPQPFHSQCQ